MNVKNSSPEKITVNMRLGTLPTLWQESAIFYSNLDCIFFGHPEKTRQLLENVSGFHGYGSRLLPIIGLIFRGNHNLLLLQEEPDPAITHYFSKSLNLRLPTVEIVKVPTECTFGQFIYDEKIRQHLRDHPAKLMDGYITDSSLESMAQDLNKKLINTHQCCRNANDKILLHRFLKQVGLPAFDGGEAMLGREVENRFTELKNMGYKKAVVRSSLGASGFGMAIAELDKIRQPAYFEELFPGEKVLVQGWLEEGNMGIDRIFSPSVQFFCDGKGIATLYDITDQLLSKNSIHQGNLSPPESFAADSPTHKEILRQAQITTSWIGSLGYSGTGSIDFLVSTAGEKITVYICEVNARVTGATYPSLLARNFNPKGAWLMRNISFGPCMTAQEFFDLLAQRDILYVPGSKKGILPLNVIISENRQITKCQLLVLSPMMQQCVEIIEAFPDLLPSSCTFDRD